MAAAMHAPDPLEQSRIFDGLTPEDRAAWLADARVRDLRRGEALAQQGDAARAFYLVEDGLLKLVQVGEDGRQLIVRFVGRGEPFGGVVALEGAEYPVTALAVGPVRVRAWARDTLLRLLQRWPQVRVNIMREMTAHMNDALTRVRELATERVGRRLAHTLLRLARQNGEPTGEGTRITAPLTRQELAELTGTTLYTVSRTLSQWQADGVLAARGRHVVVRDLVRLEVLSQATDE
jgi:CRP/FNR family transcriptional regulator, nitrogen oxide reductase regulator